ncbi:hypothetical protein JCM6882_002286 [Rhodosporidiobolus microsporus]
MASLEAKLQTATGIFTKLQNDYARAVENRQRLDAQKTENEGVKKELSSLSPSEKVFKLVGPVMLKQEQAEAKSNVEKRLEWIGGEIKRVEAQLKDFETKLEAKKLEIVHLQTQFQQQQQSASQGASGGSAEAGGAPVVQAA